MSADTDVAVSLLLQMMPDRQVEVLAEANRLLCTGLYNAAGALTHAVSDEIRSQGMGTFG